MGLIFGMIYPIYGGFHMSVLSPMGFLKHPYRWLKEISDTRATMTCAPTFAYDLCVRKVAAHEIQSLDLSSLNFACVSAEPVRIETLERFHKAFSSCGFRFTAFLPAYGMAETTLATTVARSRLVGPQIMTLNAESLAKNIVLPASDSDSGVVRLVGSGVPISDMTIRIVSPKTHKIVASSEIGELWIKGPSVASGYWNCPDNSQGTFEAMIGDTNEGPFLRTGDLGFMSPDGELYVTGRLKDLIIINGKNIYPQDVERTVENSYAPIIRSGCVAAFEVEINGEAQVVVVAEVERRKKWPSPKNKFEYLARKALGTLSLFDANKPMDFDGNKVIRSIRQNLSTENQIQVAAIVLIRAGSLPKTSSGKVQRSACKETYLQRRLNVLFEWQESIQNNVRAA
jgi:acyl-CoA synthetase (AMP-forming)/AMP-acid ligase II